MHLGPSHFGLGLVTLMAPSRRHAPPFASDGDFVFPSLKAAGRVPCPRLFSSPIICDRWMSHVRLQSFKRVAKGVSADHSCRAHDYKALLACRRNVHARPRGATKAPIEDIRLVVITVRALQSIRRRAGARQIAKRRRFSRTRPRSGERLS
jgi:hypothetical protein